jgi:ClpP class serine protease
LRIDSPGGDVNGADHIWRYLTMLAKRKPLIVSMGDVAASGGYYVAAPAHKILASPLTITGSIGIFAGKFSVVQLLKKFGIEVFSLEKDPNAHTMSLLTPWSEALEKQFITSLTELYELFLNRVLSGRNGRKLNPKNKTVEQVPSNQVAVQVPSNQVAVQVPSNQVAVQVPSNQVAVQVPSDQSTFNRAHLLKIASGRVWTGNEAYQHGLVDQIGGLSDAIEEAAKMAKLKDYEVRGYYGEAQSTIKKALGQAQGFEGVMESESKISENLIDDLSNVDFTTSSQEAQIDEPSTALLLQSLSAQASSSHSSQFLQAFTQLYQLLLLSLTPQATQQLMSIFSAISFGPSTKMMAILPWLELNSSTME